MEACWMMSREKLSQSKSRLKIQNRTLVAMIPVSLQVVKLRSRVNIFTDVRVHQLGDQVIRAKTATPPPQVQEKRRFGTWMLVTKKPNPGDTGKNTRNSRKVSNTPSVNHGNQFSLLADINEDSEPTINRQHADKNKSRTTPRQTSKGKHSTPPINSPPVPPQPRTPLPATISTPPARVHTQTARNRGGRPAAARGRGRELGRAHGLNHDIPHTNSSFTSLMNQSNSQNVFQFGGAHPLSSNMTAILPHRWSCRSQTLFHSLFSIPLQSRVRRSSRCKPTDCETENLSSKTSLQGYGRTSSIYSWAKLYR
nr:LINE-type retrotransposon LIb DNA [Ipomoea batatas]